LRLTVIGGGFAGLSAASFLAKAGHKVSLFEKNSTLGGRARTFSAQGFLFDMGPSWYWMPDVFEHFFAAFDKHPSQYYHLVQLDPGFQVIFGNDDVLSIPASLDELYAEFERIEPGSAPKLKKFLADAAYKYRVGMNSMVYKPAFSWLEFVNMEVMAGAARLQMFTPVSKYVRSIFKDPRLVALMEFPVLFLGAMASQVPALYTMMNYSALSQGTWYPMGGMGEIISAMEQLAVSLGVEIHTGCEISSLALNGNSVQGLTVGDETVATNGIVATGDYHHIERALLPASFRNYDESYWQGRTFAPSALIFYLGVNKKLARLKHHNLFFDASLDEHARQIYEKPQWPSEPLFYVCCPSKTDPSVAPEGSENIFMLMPLAPGLTDEPATREVYYEMLMRRMESYCGEPIAPHVSYKRSYCISDFVADYHAYKGNAYGLANTLRQTAVLKPTLRNKKIRNLFYAGQLTVPGPGVPPALISGRIAAEQLLKRINKSAHETIV